MPLMELEQQDDGVAVLRMTAGENRVNPDWLGEVEGVLDRLEAEDGPSALVTASEGKYWSTGLDLDWLGQQGADAWGPFVDRLHGVLARFLSLGIPTVAACTGHTFAAGAMLSLAHDVRVMRADRGYWCLPEVDINIPFVPPMNALIVAKLPQPALHEAMVTGHRYGAAEAAQKGVVDEAVAEDEVVPRSLEIARSLAGKSRGTMWTIKRRLYAPALALLEAPTELE